MHSAARAVRVRRTRVVVFPSTAAHACRCERSIGAGPGPRGETVRARRGRRAQLVKAAARTGHRGPRWGRKARAHAELLATIGPTRLPDLRDQASLPYLDSVLQEVHRVNPAVPLVHRCAERAEEYMGYCIPPGTWVAGNIWCAWPPVAAIV